MNRKELADALDRMTVNIYLTSGESDSLRKAAAALRAGVPEGWELVPVEPVGQVDPRGG